MRQYRRRKRTPYMTEAEAHRFFAACRRMKEAEKRARCQESQRHTMSTPNKDDILLCRKTDGC